MSERKELIGGNTRSDGELKEEVFESDEDQEYQILYKGKTLGYKNVVPCTIGLITSLSSVFFMVVFGTLNTIYLEFQKESVSKGAGSYPPESYNHPFIIAFINPCGKFFVSAFILFFMKPIYCSIKMVCRKLCSKYVCCYFLHRIIGDDDEEEEEDGSDHNISGFDAVELEEEFFDHKEDATKEQQQEEGGEEIEEKEEKEGEEGEQKREIEEVIDTTITNEVQPEEDQEQESHESQEQSEEEIEADDGDDRSSSSSFISLQLRNCCSCILSFVEVIAGCLSIVDKVLYLPAKNSDWFLYFISAAIDCLASSLGVWSLMYTTPSVFQMLRGFNVIPTAFLSIVLLGSDLLKYPHKITGIVLIILGIATVGVRSMAKESGTPQHRIEKTPLGPILVLSGETLRSMKLILDEVFLKGKSLFPYCRKVCSVCQKVCCSPCCANSKKKRRRQKKKPQIELSKVEKKRNKQIEKNLRRKKRAVSPIRVGVYTGYFGMIIQMTILFSLYFVPWNNTGGSFESFPHGFVQVVNHNYLPLLNIFLFLNVGFFNITGYIVTKKSAVRRVTIEMLRNFAVWVLFLFWGREEFSKMQCAGFVFIVSGTMLYNVDNKVGFGLGCPLCPWYLRWMRCLQTTSVDSVTSFFYEKFFLRYRKDMVEDPRIDLIDLELEDIDGMLTDDINLGTEEESEEDEGEVDEEEGVDGDIDDTSSSDTDFNIAVEHQKEQKGNNSEEEEKMVGDD